jgi:ABC-type phosphate/phosphonate transport system permease subunit
MKRLADFIRSRPTEVWLGGFTAAVAIAQASGVEFNPALVSAIGTAIAWVCTAVATRVDSLGPQL